MVLCIIAFFVFAAMSIFSAKYRPLAREGLRCVFRTVTFKPCDTGLDDRIKADMVSGLLRFSPPAAKMLNRHFTLFSWVFVLLTVGSLAYTIYGFYNFYYYGNCDGPESVNSCILNDVTGDYGRFSEPRELVAPASLGGITAGTEGAATTIVEFGCFTCPYTGKAEQTVQQLLSKYNGSVYYVFKPFPLPHHNNSYDAARAVLCANRQGKQWELREEIFRQQEACSVDGSMAIRQLAQDSGLDMADFDRCYNGNETGAELDGYIQEGKDAHIYATPTFFVNGKAAVGPKTLEQFECAMKEEKNAFEALDCWLRGMG
ncbi:DsbA family protein [Candidatus Micrarchaeota archaeon]|nr:DsbA family protein [Candidatus Micrarchaeota archaeon]